MRTEIEPKHWSFIDGMKRASVIVSEVRDVADRRGSEKDVLFLDKAIRLIEQEIHKFETEVDNW
jgi:hypothetical protein